MNPGKPESRKEAKTQTNSKRGKRLVNADDPLRSIKKILDQVLLEVGIGINDEVRKALVAARQVSWEAFLKAEEEVNTSTR